MNKQTTITLKVSEKTKEQMNENYNDLKKQKTPPIPELNGSMDFWRKLWKK